MALPLAALMAFAAGLMRLSERRLLRWLAACSKQKARLSLAATGFRLQAARQINPLSGMAVAIVRMTPTQQQRLNAMSSYTLRADTAAFIDQPTSF